jgi:ribosomal protein S18 acetylase RimI-like enzyme
MPLHIDGFRLELLGPHHRRERFHCRSESLNAFIRKSARKQHANHTTRVHVYSGPAGVIAGFFTLSAFTLELTGLPDALMRGRPNFPVPATLLGRFAVDEAYEGQGIGRRLLSYALREAYLASRTVAAAFVVLDVAPDATPGATKLYRSVGFVSLPSNANRMMLGMDDIARALERG